MSSGPENSFRTKLEDALKEHFPRVFIHKHHGSMMSAGMPDLLVALAPYGAALVELKAETGASFDWKEDGPTALQLESLERWERAGMKGRVVVYFSRYRVVCSVSVERARSYREHATKWNLAEKLPEFLDTRGPQPPGLFMAEWSDVKEVRHALHALIWGP